MVPLLVAQSPSAALKQLYETDSSFVVWWSTELECVSAISRLERDRDLSARGAIQALDRLDELVDGWSEIEPSTFLRVTARRLLRTHPLRAADALQLAAAITAAENALSQLAFVSMDTRLVAAAHREGLAVADIDVG